MKIKLKVESCWTELHHQALVMAKTLRKVHATMLNLQNLYVRSNTINNSLKFQALIEGLSITVSTEVRPFKWKLLSSSLFNFPTLAHSQLIKVRANKQGTHRLSTPAAFYTCWTFHASTCPLTVRALCIGSQVSFPPVVRLSD